MHCEGDRRGGGGGVTGGIKEGDGRDQAGKKGGRGKVGKRGELRERKAGLWTSFPFLPHSALLHTCLVPFPPFSLAWVPVQGFVASREIHRMRLLALNSASCTLRTKHSPYAVLSSIL